jgi:hypothetical protein
MNCDLIHVEVKMDINHGISRRAACLRNHETHPQSDGPRNCILSFASCATRNRYREDLICGSTDHRIL